MRTAVGPTLGVVLATSLFGDVAAALREHGSVALNEHYRCSRRSDRVLVAGRRNLRGRGIAHCSVTGNRVLCILSICEEGSTVGVADMMSEPVRPGIRPSLPPAAELVPTAPYNWAWRASLRTLPSAWLLGSIGANSQVWHDGEIPSECERVTC